MWMGVFWSCLGLFLVIKGGYLIPKLNIEMGWAVLALGLLRLWWWHINDKLHKQKLERISKRREFEEEDM